MRNVAFQFQIPAYELRLSTPSYPLLLSSPQDGQRRITHYSTRNPQALFILFNTSVSHPPSAATSDLNYLKQSTFTNSSPLSLRAICPAFICLEHLITLLLPTIIRNFFFPILYQTHSPVYRTPLLGQPLACFLCKQKLVYPKPATIFTLQFQSPEHPSMHLSHLIH